MDDRKGEMSFLTPLSSNKVTTTNTNRKSKKRRVSNILSHEEEEGEQSNSLTTTVSSDIILSDDSSKWQEVFKAMDNILGESLSQSSSPSVEAIIRAANQSLKDTNRSIEIDRHGLRSADLRIASALRPPIENCWLMLNTLQNEIVMVSSYQHFQMLKVQKTVDDKAIWKEMPFFYASQDFNFSEDFKQGSLSVGRLREEEEVPIIEPTTLDQRTDHIDIKFEDYKPKSYKHIVRLFEAGIKVKQKRHYFHSLI